MPSDQPRAINLSQIAERLPRPDGAPQTTRVLGGEDGGPAFDVLARDGAQDWPEEPAAQHAIYVVIAGEGRLRSGDEVLECAEGDVLFAPGGVSRRFERLGKGFATWRILLPDV